MWQLHVTWLLFWCNASPLTHRELFTPTVLTTIYNMQLKHNSLRSGKPSLLSPLIVAASLLEGFTYLTSQQSMYCILRVFALEMSTAPLCRSTLCRTVTSAKNEKYDTITHATIYSNKVFALHPRKSLWICVWPSACFFQRPGFHLISLSPFITCHCQQPYANLWPLVGLLF